MSPRPVVLPAPDRQALLAAAVQHLVRDYPETLFVLRNAGLDPRDTGPLALANALPDARRHTILAALEAATAWRGRP